MWCVLSGGEVAQLIVGIQEAHVAALDYVKLLCLDSVEATEEEGREVAEAVVYATALMEREKEREEIDAAERELEAIEERRRLARKAREDAAAEAKAKAVAVLTKARVAARAALDAERKAKDAHASDDALKACQLAIEEAAAAVKTAKDEVNTATAAFEAAGIDPPDEDEKLAKKSGTKPPIRRTSPRKVDAPGADSANGPADDAAPVVSTDEDGLQCGADGRVLRNSHNFGLVSDPCALRLAILIPW